MLRQRRAVLIITMTVIGVRLFLFFAMAPWKPDIERNNVLTGDAYWYSICAKNIIQHKIFSVSEKPPLAPDAHLTPGYPLFIAIHYLLFGMKPWVVLFSQIILQGLFALGIFILARQIKMPFSAAAIGTVIFALDPVAVMMPNLLLTESLFGIFILYSSILLIKDAGRFNWGNIIVSAILLSIAIYFKPGARFLIPVFIGVILILSHMDGCGALIRRSLIFLVILVSILAPWIGRNERLFHKPGLSYHMSLHLRNQALNTLTEARGISKEEAEKIIEGRLSLRKEVEGDNAWDAQDRNAKVYKTIIAENFSSWLKASLRNEALVYVIPGSSRYDRIFKGRALNIFFAIAVIFNLIVLAFAFIGSIEIFKLNRVIFYALLMIFLSFALSVGPFSDPRFKFATFWMLALFSGAGIYSALSKRQTTLHF